MSCKRCAELDKLNARLASRLASEQQRFAERVSQLKAELRESHELRDGLAKKVMELEGFYESLY